MWASGGRRGYLDEERTDPRRVDPEARAAAFKSAHGYNAAGVLPSMAKLVLIASNFPDKHEVLARLQCMGAEYGLASCSHAVPAPPPPSSYTK